MRAEILTIGTELLLGHCIDTNSAYIGEQLAEAGIDVYWKTTVGDNEGRIAEALRQALSRSDDLQARVALARRFLSERLPFIRVARFFTSFPMCQYVPLSGIRRG